VRASGNALSNDARPSIVYSARHAATGVVLLSKLRNVTKGRGTAAGLIDIQNVLRHRPDSNRRAREAIPFHR